MDKIVDEFNALYATSGNTSAFICFECNKLKVNEPQYYLPTSTRGYEALFCRTCCKKCNHCGNFYCNAMQHNHEDHCMY